MPPSRPAFVVAISAQPGAGKSTVARRLVDRVAGSTLVTYDALQRVTTMSVAELAAWEEAGADCDAFDLAPIERELERQKGSGASLIVFETPLGRRHRRTARFIDSLVWVDTPFDVALARAMQKIIVDNAGRGVSADGTQRWLASYLQTYQDLLWRIYRRQYRDFACQADLVVTGTERPRVIVEAIVAHLRGRGILSPVDGHPGVEG